MYVRLAARHRCGARGAIAGAIGAPLLCAGTARVLVAGINR
jgi:hypothetical protein